MINLKRYYLPAIAPDSTLEDSGDLARHLAVAGHGVGDCIRLFDGSGAEYDATVIHIGKRRATVEVKRAEFVDRELPLAVTIATALPKQPRQQMTIEKLTELGVARIVPLICRYSVAVIRPGDRKKLEKLRRWAIEACKQCGRTRIPQIGPPMTFGELVEDADGLADGTGEAARWILSMREDARPVGEVLGAGEARSGAIVAAIGPEGGWSDREEAQARQAGFTPIRLAPTVLRIETAGLALMAQVGGIVQGG